MHHTRDDGRLGVTGNARGEDRSRYEGKPAA